MVMVLNLKPRFGRAMNEARGGPGGQMGQAQTVIVIRSDQMVARNDIVYGPSCGWQSEIISG